MQLLVGHDDILRVVGCTSGVWFFEESMLLAGVMHLRLVDENSYTDIFTVDPARFLLG